MISSQNKVASSESNLIMIAATNYEGIMKEY